MMALPGQREGKRPSASSSSSGSTLPMYTQGGLAEDYITIGHGASEKTAAGQTGQRPLTEVEPAPAYIAPAAHTDPPFRSHDEPRTSFIQRHRSPIGWAVYIVFVLGTGAGLGYACWTTREKELWTQEETPEMTERMLKHHIYLFLTIGFASFVVSNLLITVFPYLFRAIAPLVNPGHKKYWKIFWKMTSAVTCLGGAIGTYVSYTVLVLNNKELLVNAKKAAGGSKIEQLLTKYLTRLTIRPAFRPWPRIFNDVQTVFLLWSVFFFFEQLAMLYISIHYHYRSDGTRIQRTKRTRKALVLLWEASTSLNAPLSEPFQAEDEIIANRKKDHAKFFQKTRPAKIIDSALEDPRSAAALAKRIWTSLVREGCDVLTAEDIIDVLPPNSKQQGQECFETLDENQNGDLTLNEMVLAVMEVGTARRQIYQGITDINHAIKALDWIACIVITMVVLAYLILRFVKSFRGLKDAMGITLLGLSFGFGRTLYEFLNGCIFIFLKHAYDVGDRIEVYNIAATMRTSVVVTRISILYTIFRRVDNGKDLQMSNDRLNMKRIENVSRSGANREELSVHVGFDTSFTDIERLRAELTAFVRARANRRDYQPHVAVRLHSIAELNKLELVVGVVHKSNWAHEELRAARSSKFKCALLAAVRRVPLAKPSGGLAAPPPPPPGFEQEREDMAYSNFTAVPLAADERVRGNLAGQHAGATGVEINEWIGPGRTGMRQRQEPYGQEYPYGA